MKLSIIGNYVKTLKERLSNSIGLPFQDILSQDMIEQTLKDMNIKYRQRLYDPIITLWAFICQVLDDDKSCSKAVSRINAFLADRYNKLPSADTGAYCKARKRLNLSFIISLLKRTGQALHHKPTDEYLNQLMNTFGVTNEYSLLMVHLYLWQTRKITSKSIHNRKTNINPLVFLLPE